MAATSSRWCQTEDDEGNSFTDDDIVNHMIFLMMAAHDTSTSTTTTMAYHLAAHPEWQDRARDESARLGDGPLDIEALEKLETLDLVTSRCSHGPNTSGTAMLSRRWWWGAQVHWDGIRTVGGQDRHPPPPAQVPA
jgi:hypothetical protein